MADFFYETERLILRDWREEDWGEQWRLTNTPVGMRWLGGVQDEKTLLETRERIESYGHQHGFTFWLVERKDDGGHFSGEMLGMCGLKRGNVEGSPVFGMMEVGWRFREDSWGKGYAKEAAIASLDLAFGQFGAEETVALTVSGNEASWGLMLALGMERREDFDFHDARFGEDLNPTIVHAISRLDWLKRRNG